MPRAAQLPRTSGLFKKVYFLRKSSAPGSEAAPGKWLVQTNLIYEKKFCPQQRSCPGQVACSKPNQILKESSAPGSEAALDKWLVQKKVGFLRKCSAPGSEATPDKWLGREKTNNRCSQGRGAPFGGSGGLRSLPERRGVRGGAAPRLPRPQIRAKFIVRKIRSTALAKIRLPNV